MIQLLWYDGHSMTARTWAEAERCIRAAQWTAYPSRMAFRRDLRYRAKVWGGVAIPRGTSSRGFIQGLERAGLLRVEEGEEEL